MLFVTVASASIHPGYVGDSRATDWWVPTASGQRGTQLWWISNLVFDCKARCASPRQLPSQVLAKWTFVAAAHR